MDRCAHTNPRVVLLCIRDPRHAVCCYVSTAAGRTIVGRQRKDDAVAADAEVTVTQLDRLGHHHPIHHPPPTTHALNSVDLCPHVPVFQPEPARRADGDDVARAIWLYPQRPRPPTLGGVDPPPLTCSLWHTRFRRPARASRPHDSQAMWGSDSAFASEL